MIDIHHPYWRFAERWNGRLAMVGLISLLLIKCLSMIPLALLFTSIPPGSRDLLEFGFFVAVGMTAGSLGLI